VLKAAVVGLPHERWGEAVTAVVVVNGDGSASGEDLLAFCRERLAGFETPKNVVFVDELPETVGGKVLKYKLRQRYVKLYTQSR
jgi:acyl-CoA synthetase (AMP-forming)/AMP-acid ligase II